MAIYLTDHAQKRCRQRGIIPTDVYKSLKNAPDTFGKPAHWKLKDGGFLWYARKGKHIHVITVVARFRKKKKKRRR